jgi:hypothetical protein
MTATIVQTVNNINHNQIDKLNLLWSKIPAIKPTTTNSRGAVLMICL